MSAPKNPAYVDTKALQRIANLKLDRETPEMRSAKAKKAAASLAENNRRKKTMREVAKTMLETELCVDDELRTELGERGFKDYTEAAAVLLAQLNRARQGDTEAAKFIRDTSGQRPADQVALGTFDDLPVSAMDLSELPDDVLLHLIEQRGGLDALTK